MCDSDKQSLRQSTTEKVKEDWKKEKRNEKRKERGFVDIFGSKLMDEGGMYENENSNKDSIF